MDTPHISTGIAVSFRTRLIPLSDRRALAHVPRGRRRRAAARGRCWSDWTRNLITDVGLDMPPSYQWRNLLQYIAVGTGTRATKRDSGSVTAARAGTTVTASGAFFAAADVGRTLKLDSGAVTKITGYTSATVVTVADSGTDAASEFTIWYTNDSTHEAESVYFGAGAVSFTVTNNVWTVVMRGTSAAFASSTVLREIGWRPTATGALFGRALIPAGGDSVAAGQQYQVDVALSLSPGPIAPTDAASVGTGLSTAGKYCFTSWGMNADGSPAGNSRIFADSNRSDSSYLGAEPSETNNMGLYAMGAAAMPPALTVGAISSPGQYTMGAVSRAGYVSGSKTVTWTRTYNVSQANGTIGGITIGNGYEVFRHTFTTPITKTSLQTLSVSFRLSWDRVLNN